MSAPARDWDAAAYHRVSSPQAAMAEAVLDRLELAGDETVLDAGCGSGRVTRLLLDRLPRGRVIAVDASPGMVARAHEELAGEAADVRIADLAALRLDGGERVDAVFSNAAFHWVPDHDALFARLAAALRPGGRVSAQCGGAGNVAAVHATALRAAADAGLADRFDGWPPPWNFATPEQTEQRLRHAGFQDVRCWLEPRPVRPDEPRAYLQTVCLGPHLERLPAGDRERFLDAVMARLGSAPTLDYIRLNIVARRASRYARSVTSQVPLRHMTAQELLEYRHEPYRHELVDGILYEMEPPGAEHGFVATRVGRSLIRHVDDADGIVFTGEVGFHLSSDPDTVRAPDVAFVGIERVPDTGIPRGYWSGPPDLAVEVVSPNDRRSKVEGKALHWLAAGTRAVVVLDPPLRTATVYRARDDIRVLNADELLELGDVVPGWSARVGDFFV
ncbi:MAG: Uma2 family endonuclease [Solirubrobacteraceae bacterium]|nr:Uma2 family endonuclease [Solirubrobacteraceae bacterium]